MAALRVISAWISVSFLFVSIFCFIRSLYLRDYTMTRCAAFVCAICAAILFWVFCPRFW